MTRTIAIIFALLGMSLANAQPATPAQMAGVTTDRSFGTIHFQTRLGSFKVLNGKGRIEFTFKGTVLINGLKGTQSVTGKVRKEFDKNQRVVYTGTGRVVVTGEWRGVQWFGQDVSGVWYGHGVIRFSGEFDQDQKTGEYWFDDPAKVDYWPGSNSMDIPNPRIVPGYNPDVKVKKKGS